MTPEATRIRRLNPLEIGMALPLTATFYPLGFPLDLATNSPDVIEAAEESWGWERQSFDTRPLTMQVIVRPPGELTQQGAHRKIGHLYSVVSDQDNFAQVDLRELFAGVHVSQKTASNHVWLRWYFVESLAYLMLSQRHVALIHAAVVARDGLGVLLCGPGGAGKSTLAYACARAGWTYIADDWAALPVDSVERIALGRPRQARFRPDAVQRFPELEGFAARQRPTGKIAFEAPTTVLNIRTADRAVIGAIVFLERGSGPPRLVPVSSDEAITRLLADMPSYGNEVDSLHERAVKRLDGAQTNVVRYESVDDGVRLLSSL